MTPAPVLQGTEQPNHIFNKDRCAQLITHFVHPNGSGFPRPLSQQEHARINLLQRACLRQDITFLLTHQIYCLATYDAFSLPQQLQTAPYLGALCQKLDSILMPNNQLTWPVLGWFATFPAPLKDVTQSAPELYGSKLKLFESFASHTASNWERLKTICDERGYPPLVGEIMNYLGANSAVLQHVVFLSITRSLWGMDETPWFREAERLFFKNQDEWNKALSHHINGTMDPQIVTKYNMWYISRYITLFHLHKGSITPEIAFQQLGSNDFQSSPFADLISTGPRARPIVPSNVPVQGPAFDGRIATAPAGAIQAAANTAGRNQPQFRGSAIHAQGPVQHFHAQLPPNVPQQSFETQIQITTPINAHAQQIHQSPPVPLPIRPGALLPPPGFLRNQQVQPDPSLSSLHLAHLRSPILKAKEMSADPSAPKPKLFQFVRSVQPRFALELPICKKQYQFDVSDNDSLIPKDTPSDLGEPPTRTITPNSVIFRLRCCKRQGFGVGQLKDESAWVVSDTVWPPFFYFSMNGTILEPRKKLHYAKDHPIDLTPYVKPGNNTVEVSANVCKDDHSPLAYLFAVEVLSVTTQENIRAHCNAHVIPANESIDAIKKSLAGNDDDDDLAIVSSNLSITLFDPFIGCKIFDTPVRGTRCLHRNCFDLETFLATRKCVKGADSPSKVDVWACPICKADARPQSLVVDGFLVQVRKELEAQGELETRAIIVEQDGSWKPKAEKESGSGDVPSRGRSEASKTPAVGMDRRDSIRAEAATASGGVAVRTPTKEKVLEIIDLGGDSSDAEMAAAA